ncbi:MAG: histone deacetylase, partial [Planctomycetota bacterium]
KNFPSRKQRSDLDVPLPDGTTDEPYLDALRPALETALDRARPDLILYQGGVDPLAEDKLGRLSLTHEGLYARDVHVFERARTLGLPVALTLGGGYANPIEPTVEANVGTYRAAKSILEDA